MGALVQDLRYARRAFRANPGVVLAAVASLAIGIGANTAIFSVAHALLMRPLPYRHADRLVILWNQSPGLGITQDWFSTAQYFDIRTGHRGFDAVAIAIGSNYNLTGEGEPARVGVIRVSSNLLPLLGAQAMLGQLFDPGDDLPGRPGTAVLGFGTWTRRYGGDPGVIGRSLVLNGLSYRVAGVLPRSFSLPREVLPTLGLAEDGDIFLPLPLGPAAGTTRTHEDYNIIGMLRQGVSVRQAQAEMDALTARLRQEHPDAYPPNGGLTFLIRPLLDQVVGPIRRPLLLIMGAVAFVLVIACANVANLLLARALARRKEIAVRMSLGAGRARLLRQLLTESVVLALAGGAAGIILAILAIAWVRSVQPADVPRVYDIGLNGTVLLFTLGVSLVSGVLFGLAPAAALRRLDLHGTLKDTGRSVGGAGGFWGHGRSLRHLLVVAELALSVMLLIGAGLLIRSFARLERVAPGFSADGVLSVELTMTGGKYANAPAVFNAYHELWDRLERLPGVQAAGGVSSLPLSGYFSWGPITVEGRVPPPGEQFINADERVVGGHYFEAMRIPLLRGRTFTDQDAPDHPRVIVVDERMASDLWPGQDPIGKRVRLGGANSTGPWHTVVGVVGRVKQYGLDLDDRIALYLPQAQSPSRAMYVVARGSGDAAALAPGVSAAIHGLDPDLPLYHVRTMATVLEASLARQRFSMLLLALFASIALALATVGVYGVMSYLVNQGARDLGLRIALGATPSGIVGLVLRQGLGLAVAGIVLGLAGAAALGRAMASLLFGISGSDPLTFAAVALALGLVAAAAAYGPARRAARTDPIVSLRLE